MLQRPRRAILRSKSLATYPVQPDEGKTFLGHPRGLYVLFFAEMWERFSYYGMRALLIFYLVKHWLYSDSEASIIYGAYTALVYITPVVGGYLADRYLGQRKAVQYGAILLVIGHGLMAFEGSGGQDDPTINVFWLALAFIIMGVGFLKANISVIVGQLYPRTDIPPRPGLHDFLHGHQSGCVPGFAHRRLAGRDLRLVLGLRCGRRGHVAGSGRVHLGVAPRC